jgi:hypothetical protein
LILLLPERRRFAGQPLSRRVAGLLGRAERLADGEPGEQAQLQRYFRATPAGWPMAAICRQAEAGDASGFAWLRADPVFVRPDMNGARLMAWGNLGLSSADAAALVAALQPACRELGLELSATAPERWYLRLPPNQPAPTFAAPSEALGEDLLGHLPPGDAGRRWRGLLNEAQIILHNHPLNAARAGKGLPAVNSVWFWGGGLLPDSVSCPASQVVGADADLLALASLAGLPAAAGARAGGLLDLRRERDWPVLERGALASAVAHTGKARTDLVLDFADGARWRLAPAQRWRFWRRPLAGLGA